GSLVSDSKAWIISANMGLGHMRATYSLRDIAYGKIMAFGEDELMSKGDKKLYKVFKHSYESMSRIRRFPLLGPHLFSLFDQIQNIQPYYPLMDRSASSLQTNYLDRLVRKGFGSYLSTILSKQDVPLITSFYASAIAAEKHTDQQVYCIICDADINRVWVSKHPEKSRIIYFAPCGQAMRRLMQYGVPHERIYLTGFPLPMQNIGDGSMNILKRDLSSRLTRLDPTHQFRTIHDEECRHYLGDVYPARETDQPITVTYCVGGAGAQKEIASEILSSLKDLIIAGIIKVNLVAGIRREVNDYFNKIIAKYGLKGKNVKITYNSNLYKYFDEFSEILHDTDLLWTKPSEISFYCGLGIPIIVSPPIGAHEKGNMKWLHEIGAGLPMENPKYCNEWLMDYINGGRLAQAAWHGFLYARKIGTLKIREVIESGKMEREFSPLLR
ncbi:MAG: hypothetical protein PHV32_12020, partial [Eubacteriales bacterium]|nr:hypothetical protein [Eubacteriales bacterium]